MNASIDISASEFVQVEDVIRFLLLHQPQGPWVLWAKEADGPVLWCSDAFYPGDEDKVEAWVIRHALHNLYYHVNQYPGVRQSPSGAFLKANKTDIAQVPYLHVDVDPIAPPVGASDEEKASHTESERSRIRALLTDAEPTVLVDSGGGFQALFRLVEPIMLDRTEDMADEVARRNHALAVRFGGDIAAKDVSRVLRLPGTTNWPDRKKREKGRKLAPTTLLRYDGKAFPLSDFPLADKKSPASRPISDTITAPLTPGDAGESGQAWSADCGEVVARLPVDLAAIIRTGGDARDPARWPSRSEAVYFVACSLVRASCSDLEIANILTNSDYEISAHVREQKDPREYALKQARSAREDVGSGPWC